MLVENRAVDRDGRTVATDIEDSDFTMYIISSYVASYIFLMFFIDLAIMLSTNRTQKC